MGRLLSCVNIFMFVALIVLFIWRPVVLMSPWDGPALATTALTAATLVLAAVAIGVGILAAMGFAELRKVAESAAVDAIERADQQRVKGWLSGRDDTGGDSVAAAYSQENPNTTQKEGPK